jgi:hypothetical protein
MNNHPEDSMAEVTLYTALGKPHSKSLMYVNLLNPGGNLVRILDSLGCYKKEPKACRSGSRSSLPGLLLKQAPWSVPSFPLPLITCETHTATEVSTSLQVKHGNRPFPGSSVATYNLGRHHLGSMSSNSSYRSTKNLGGAIDHHLDLPKSHSGHSLMSSSASPLGSPPSCSWPQFWSPLRTQQNPPTPTPTPGLQ